MNILYYLLLSGIVVILTSCSQHHFDARAEAEKLLRRDAEWTDLATAGKDIEKVVSYWSDDAILIFPGQPVLEGKAAIRTYVTGSVNTPGLKIHCVSQKPIFSPDGKLAYLASFFASFQTGSYSHNEEKGNQICIKQNHSCKESFNNSTCVALGGGSCRL